MKVRMIISTFNNNQKSIKLLEDLRECDLLWNFNAYQRLKFIQNHIKLKIMENISNEPINVREKKTIQRLFVFLMHR